MMNEKLAATTENRTYYFYLLNEKDGEVTINMYGTNYTLIRGESSWDNHGSNYFAMAPHLIDAIVETIRQNDKQLH
jgi:hypothetical protein